LITISFSQEVQKDSVTVKLDSLYREDQFYFSLTYNNLQNKPSGLNQDKFSPSISVGFLRDMPINKDRTIAIATGIGYSLNVFNHNLQTSDGDLGPGVTRVYEIINSNTYFSKNKLSLHYVDLPIEFRYRTSTPETHRFWRIYTGFKVSYLFADTYKFEGNGVTFKDTNNPDLNKIQYGTYLAMGWNTWNAYVYYRLNPIYKSAEIDGKPLDLTTINFGLMFYIL
jgi:hypothetical protein